MNGDDPEGAVPKTSKPQAPASEQAKEAAGCGCLLLIAMVAGPIITDAIGLSPWPMAAVFGIGAIAVLKSKTSPFKFGSNLLLAFMVIGAVGAIAFGNRVAGDNDRNSKKVDGNPPTIAEQPTAKQGMPESTPSAIDRITPVRSLKPAPTPLALPSPEIVRTDIDEVLARFARNQIAGAQYFKGRTVMIRGRAIRVREALGTGILVMRSPKSQTTMEIGFSDSGTPQLGAVEPGDVVDATCPEIQEMMGQVIIVCSDIKVFRRRN